MLKTQETQGNTQQDTATQTQQALAPAISLPKGGGAIRGIGEKFAANPVTGTGSMTVPIATSPGRSGFGPQLALSYDSGASNGPFGFGWGLALPSIIRKTDKGLPKYEDAEESDVFILSGAEDLVPVLVEKNGTWERDQQQRTINGELYHIQRYRPRIEGLFARIERWTHDTDPRDTFWQSISKDNITTWYGKTTDSRIADPVNSARIFSWLICESYDDKGNIIAYQYKSENSDDVDRSQAHERNRTADTRKVNRYVKYIKYGNHAPYFPKLLEDQPWPTVPADDQWFFEVVFDYGEHDTNAPTPKGEIQSWKRRPDPFSSYRAGFEVRTYRLCQRVLMFHRFAELGATPCLVRSTDFAYTYEEKPADPRNPIYSVLLAVSQSGYKRQSGGYLKKSLPPLEFAYTESTIDETVRDVNPQSLENLPYGLDGANYQWVDLDGEGLSGMLTEQAEAWFYKRNLSPLNVVQHNGKAYTEPHFAPLELITEKPSLAAMSSGQQQLLDLAGDGQLDLVAFHGPTPGFYERTPEAGWEPFRPFTALPNLDWSDANLKFVDLTGDGHADILLTEDDVFWWYPSQAEAGFGPAERVPQAWDEEKGPRLVFADGTQSIYIADLSGDGLADLVRIRNGEICYWPNLGYGHFGTKVTMDNAPWFDHPDHFNQQRVRLADIDGSGATDLIYLGRDGVRLYFNQSGNRWSEARTLPQFPGIDNLAAVTVVDLLGNGTACIVWASFLPGDARRPMRYIDLMDGQKPHLLVSVKNNLGVETRVHYAPSTKFYLADKAAGAPWVTRLSFPVHVVERVETYDRVSKNRFVTRYAYHHGYFDGIEREFRGFGMVEQWDTEEIGKTEASNISSEATNLDAASFVPPIHTKTWFHTGAYFEGKRLEEFYKNIGGKSRNDAYFREPGVTDQAFQAMLLPDTVVPTTILQPDGTRSPYTPSTEEVREASRALKGAILRQEVYADDSTARAGMPYSVSERNYTLEFLQPESVNRHAVFFTHARETVDFHYERKLFKVVGNTLVDPQTAPSTAKDAADPRVTHAITLAVDGYGNMLQSVAIGYGRRFTDPALAAEDQDKQNKTLITHTESRYTRALLESDAYL